MRDDGKACTDGEQFSVQHGLKLPVTLSKSFHLPEPVCSHPKGEGRGGADISAAALKG